MKADLIIRNARVVDHTGEFFGGVAVTDGKILMTGTDDALPQAKRAVDAEGRCLFPGVIDTHCHLGVAYPYDEDMRTETAQAARGGFPPFFYISGIRKNPICRFTMSVAVSVRKMSASISVFISAYRGKNIFTKFRR